MAWAGESFVAGIGVSSTATLDSVRRLLTAALASVDLKADALVGIASISARSDSVVLKELAAELNVELAWHDAQALAAVSVPSPSARVAEHTGSASVAEAAALLGLDRRIAVGQVAEVIVEKMSDTSATVAIARHWLPELTHHGDVEVMPGMLDLAVNVTTEPQPRWLTEAISDAMTRLAQYPDARAATAAVATHHGRDVREVLLTAGAAEAFSLIAQGVPRRGAPGTAVIVHPQFTEPEVALLAAGWQVNRLVLQAGNGFRFDPAQVDPDADLVVIGNPTNPTGTLHPAESVLALLKPGRTVVVDEAFMDTVVGQSQSLVDARRGELTGLIVVRSLTKIWALAGLRIGYVVADAKEISRLAAVQPRWSVSTPALAAAQACMSDEAIFEADRRARQISDDRERLRPELVRRGFGVLDDRHGSFLLLKHPRARQLHGLLRAHGVAVRRGDTFPGLGSRWLRVAVRGEDDAARFLAVLDEVIPR